VAVRRNATKRAAIAGALAALLGVVTVLAVTGSREQASALKLLSGDVWLGNVANGSASHVNGYSGKVDGAVPVSHPGDPFTVVQRPDGAYVLDSKTGQLALIGSAGLTVTATRQLAGRPSATQVLTSGATTWVLDRSSGILQPLNPTSMNPSGPQIPLGAPTGVATVDRSGNLWVPIPAQGMIKEVRAGDGAISDHPLGQAGDQLQVAATANGVWAVDPQGGQAISLTNPSIAALQLPQVAAAATPLIGSSTVSDHIAIVQGDQLLDINTRQPSLASTSSPEYRNAGQIALNGEIAYLLDAASHSLQSVNLDPLGPGTTVNVPPGSDQLVTKDNLVFVNNQDSPQAVVVNTDGQVTPVTKYIPAPAAPGPASPLAPPPPPSPAPQASGVTPGPQPPLAAPAGPQAGGSAPGAGGGSGPVPASVPASPTAVPPSLPVPSPPGPARPPGAGSPPKTQPSAPGTPTVDNVTAAGASMTVNWSAPASTGSGPITSFSVLVTSSADPTDRHPTTTGDGTTLTAKVAGLKGDTTYCAQVQATNSAGSSPLSANTGAATMCARTTTDLPGAVTGVTVTGAQDSVKVTWSAVSDLGPFSTPINHYVISAGGQSVTAGKTLTSVTVPGLAANTAVTASVQAVNDNGGQGPAGTGGATTYNDPVGFGITITPTNAGELTVRWTAQSSNNPKNPFTYSASANGVKGTLNGTTAVFDGLTATNYNVTVTLTSGSGKSATGTGGATPYVRSTPFLCESTDKGNQFVWPDPCGQMVAIRSLGSASFAWPTSSPAGAGSVVLYAAYGTTTPAYYSSGTQFYYVQGQASQPPGAWFATPNLSAQNLHSYVWTSARAAPPGATELCEALVSQTYQGNHTSYYQLFTNGSQPGGSACIHNFWV